MRRASSARPRGRERDRRRDGADRAARATRRGGVDLRDRDLPGERSRARATSSTRTRGARPRGGASTRRSTLLREAGIPAHGFVVETDPVDARARRARPARAAARRDHRLDASRSESGWLRRERRRPDPRVAGGCRSSTSSSTSAERGRAANVLVVANETVLGEPLLDKIRERAAQGAGELPDHLARRATRRAPTHPEAERRLRRALAMLRSEGIEAHGQIAHPDPFTAAMQAVHDERVDEIIVSTFPAASARGWLRRDLVERLRNDDEAARRARRRRRPAEVGA